jgi:hypothetical protein
LFRNDDEVNNALYHGALGPDMGMFPGGDPLLSDLAHYVKTADLARALVACARDEVEQAYAWGWVTHVLADSGLHPAINRAAGQVAWSDSPEPHLRVEFGLDFARLAGTPWLARVRLHQMKNLEFVVDAYRETYEFRFDSAQVRRAHRMVTIGQRALFGMGPGSRRFRPFQWVGSRFPGTVLSAISRPIPPEPWLLEELALALEEQPRHLQRLREGGLAELENLNLDTGVPVGASDQLAEKALRSLEDRRGV